jgi:hypothetical protein
MSGLLNRLFSQPNHLSIWAVTTVLLLLATPPPLRADLYYEQVSSLKPVGQEDQPAATMKLKVYVRHRMVRAEDTGSKKIIIARLDKGLIWGINQADKTYSELTIKELADNWQEARRSAGVDEPAKSAIRLEEAPKEETVSGYPCRKFTLLLDGQPVMQTWNTPSIDAPEKADLYDYTRALGEFPKAILEKTRSLPGFPLRVEAIKTIGAGKVETFREIVLIQFDPVDPKLFELPEGFKKVEVK